MPSTPSFSEEEIQSHVSSAVEAKEVELKAIMDEKVTELNTEIKNLEEIIEKMKTEHAEELENMANKSEFSLPTHKHQKSHTYHTHIPQNQRLFFKCFYFILLIQCNTKVHGGGCETEWKN